MKTRIPAFDAVKSFAIFLVVWGHSIQYLMPHDFFHNPMFELIYAFHMPLFMMVSGFFAFSSTKPPFIRMIKHKFIQLILPCISWGILSILLHTVKIVFKGEALDINTLAASIYHTLNGNYWFLKSLFCCYLIFNILFRLSHRNTIFLVIACLLTTISTGKYSISFMFPFFCIGILLNHYSDWLQSHLKPIAYISAVLFIGMYLFWDGNYTVYQSPSFTFNYFLKGDALPVAAITTFRFLIGLAGSLCSISLFMLWGRRERQHRLWNILCRYGRYTLGIYILQSLILEGQLSKIGLRNMNMALYDFVVTPVIALITITLCILLIRCIERYRLPSLWLLGKEK